MAYIQEDGADVSRIGRGVDFYRVFHVEILAYVVPHSDNSPCLSLPSPQRPWWMLTSERYVQAMSIMLNRSMWNQTSNPQTAKIVNKKGVGVRSDRWQNNRLSQLR